MSPSPDLLCRAGKSMAILRDPYFSHRSQPEAAGALVLNQSQGLGAHQHGDEQTEREGLLLTGATTW